MRKMLKGLSIDEFRDWMAFDEIEPIGDTRRDLQAGQVCAAIMNSLMMRVGAYSDEKAFKAEHFLIDFDDLFTTTMARVKGETKSEKPGQEKWRTWKFLAKMSAAAANADEKKRLIREEKIRLRREQTPKREAERALKRQQEADKKAKERSDRAAARKVRKK